MHGWILEIYPGWKKNPIKIGFIQYDSIFNFQKEILPNNIVFRVTYLWDRIILKIKGTVKLQFW